VFRVRPSQSAYNKQISTGVHYLPYHTSFELVIKKTLEAKPVPKLNITLQYNPFGFIFPASVMLMENNKKPTTKTMIQAQAVNKSD